MSKIFIPPRQDKGNKNNPPESSPFFRKGRTGGFERVSAIICAAGKGNRMAGATPAKQVKQFLNLGGRPLLTYSLKTFIDSSIIEQIVLVVPKGMINYTKKKVVAKLKCGRKKILLIEGGKERQDSVSQGLKALSDDTKIVVIHDGVRPFVTREMINEVVKQAIKFRAAVTAIPMTDTVKKAEGKFFIRTVDRSRLWRIQTPQAFEYSLIRKAYETASALGYYATDDASLVENLGVRIKIVLGSIQNIKVTTLEDFRLAEAILDQISNIKNQKHKSTKTTR
ncbi:MAG: 2-C-methyl-D-erythritol 4-phosphate cytidylyltransferase [Candidatus Edwardsbacteria bacterium]